MKIVKYYYIVVLLSLCTLAPSAQAEDLNGKFLESLVETTGHSSHSQYFIELEDLSLTELDVSHISGEELPESGSIVKVTGFRNQRNFLVVQKIESVRNFSRVSEQARQTISKPVTRLITVFRTSDASCTERQVSDILLAVAAETEVISGGSLLLNFDHDGDGAPDIYNLPAQVEDHECNFADVVSLTKDRIKQLAKQGDFAIPENTDHWSVVTNTKDNSSSCDNKAGQATVNGIHSTLVQCKPAILHHELGHNLGLRHARIDLNHDGHFTEDEEYADQQSIMGNHLVLGKSHNPVHQVQAGFMKRSKIEALSFEESKDYRVALIDHDDIDLPQAFTLNKRGAPTHYISFQRLLGSNTPVLNIHKEDRRYSVLVKTLQPNEQYFFEEFGLNLHYKQVDTKNTSIFSVAPVRSSWKHVGYARNAGEMIQIDLVNELGEKETGYFGFGNQNIFTSKTPTYFNHYQSVESLEEFEGEYDIRRFAPLKNTFPSYKEIPTIVHLSTEYNQDLFITHEKLQGDIVLVVRHSSNLNNKILVREGEIVPLPGFSKKLIYFPPNGSQKESYARFTLSSQGPTSRLLYSKDFTLLPTKHPRMYSLYSLKADTISHVTRVSTNSISSIGLDETQQKGATRTLREGAFGDYSIISATEGGKDSSSKLFYKKPTMLYRILGEGRSIDIIFMKGNLFTIRAQENPSVEIVNRGSSTSLHPNGFLLYSSTQDLPLTTINFSYLDSMPERPEGPSICNRKNDSKPPFCVSPIKPTKCVDTDGDGWGWDGQSSCLIDYHR